MNCLLSIKALVFYDHLITFKYEIEFLWRRKWSTSTWIFVYNRYSVIAEILFEVVPIDSQVRNSHDSWTLSLTFVDVSAHSQYSYDQVRLVTDHSCDDRPLLNTLFFFFVGELSSLPFHGVSKFYAEYATSTFTCTAFTILRAYALLQDHSWRLQATWTLVTLALTAVVLDSVRICPLSSV